MSSDKTGFAPPIQSYDFHIYYHHQSKPEAINLKNKIFDELQDWIDQDKLIVKVLRDEHRSGPHITPFYEIDIEDAQVFPYILSWLQHNHGTLSILVHPNSGDVFKDHTEYASWIGDKLPLITTYLEGHYGYPEYGFPHRDLILNEGFYKDPTKYNKSIMIRLLEKGPEDKFWDDTV